MGVDAASQGKDIAAGEAGFDRLLAEDADQLDMTGEGMAGDEVEQLRAPWSFADDFESDIQSLGPQQGHGLDEVVESFEFNQPSDADDV